MLIDSHAHLDFENIKYNFSSIIQRAQEKNISSILSINTKIKDFTHLYKLISKYKSIWCSVGEHPCNINNNNIPSKKTILSHTVNEKVIAIGETGLDLYYSNKYIDYQFESLQNHLDASIDSQLPLIIHLRNSADELIKYLTNENKKKQLKLVMHCFTENKNFLFKCLDNDFYISLSGIITFKKSTELQNLVKFIPLKKLLIETDSPFLSPTPLRGKINEPSYIYYTALFISKLLDIDINILSKHICDNFYNLFSKAIRYNQIKYEN